LRGHPLAARLTDLFSPLTCRHASIPLFPGLSRQFQGDFAPPFALARFIAENKRPTAEKEIDSMALIQPSRFLAVPPGPASIPAVVNTIVEIPKGRRSKFELDKNTGLIKLDRYLYSSLMYPGDYGFIPQTLAEDGDPLDIIVMVNEATFSGCLIEARPIGLFKMTDKGFNDYKILAVPHSDPIFADFHDLWRVPAHFLREVEHFFATYKQLEAATVVTQGWEPADRAKEEVLKCIERYNAQLKASGDTKPRFSQAKPKGKSKVTVGSAAKASKPRSKR
jgi:inorganic pyrophosphatase